MPSFREVNEDLHSQRIEEVGPVGGVNAVLLTESGMHQVGKKLRKRKEKPGHFTFVNN